MGIWTGVLNNIVQSYLIIYHNVFDSTIIEQHAKFYQHYMKNVHVRHLGHVKFILTELRMGVRYNLMNFIIFFSQSYF